MQTQILTLLVLIILSAFFSGSELALFSLSNLRAKMLLKKKVKGAELVYALKSNPQRLLITILIGNNLVNIGASALATSIAFQFSINYAVGITTGVMTLLILVFGEITPKSLATKHNEKISLMVARPLSMLQTILYPIVLLFEKFSNLLVKSHKEKPAVTEEELKAFVSIGQEIGQIKESEREMIHRVFRFNDLEAREIMTPRNQMVCVEADTLVKDVIPIFHNKGHSRLLLYHENLDRIKGFVHVLDVYKADKKKKVIEIRRPILVVPGSKKLDSLLKFFQRKKKHIAVVVDEHGTNIGLVTLEDVLEEIVGEIIDETEKIEPMIRKVGRRLYLVQGRADIDEINEKCNLALPEKNVPYTLSSYILRKLGRIPEENEVITFPGCKVKIKVVHHNTIQSATIKKQYKK